jgi:flagellin
MSSDLLTNNSAMTALLSLNQTQQSLNTYENQISTGLAISSAQQNAAYWSIATSMNSQIDTLGAVSSSLSESSSLLSTMTAAMNQTISVLDAIQTDLTTASSLINQGADADQISDTQDDITDRIQSLISLGQSTDVNGVNFLVASAGSSVNLLASYTSTGGASFISVDTGATALFNVASTAATTGILGAAGSASGLSVLNFNVTGATAGGVANMLADIGTAIKNMTAAASTVGADQNNVEEQQSFISNLTDSLTSSVGSLVDADMNEASTKISALQVQQQLGVQALSIANSNTQLILKLFGQ